MIKFRKDIADFEAIFQIMNTISQRHSRLSREEAKKLKDSHPQAINTLTR
jgi:hypothetical protein